MKRVEKPWGWEEWLELDRYCMKRIFLRAGHRTSLQFHNSKQETNLILSGTAMFTLDGVERLVQPGDVLTVRPPQIHRFQAVTDLTMIEASTPEVDDVVRVADDFHRPNGRIESEHTGA